MSANLTVSTETTAAPDIAPALSAEDPDVRTAFLLGWELTSIMRLPPAVGEVSPHDELLRLDALSPPMRAKLAIGLVESSLHRLRERTIASRPLDPSRAVGLQAILEREGKSESLGRAIVRLHEDALLALVAADSKLGRAYALGHELSEVSLEPRNRGTVEAFNASFGAGVVTIRDRLADLASSFPPHASRAVVLSLRAWESWAAEPKLNKRQLDWKSDGAGVTVALARQGELWRDLLTGDKLGQDMLDARHYIQAAKSMVKVVTRFALPVIAMLFISVLLLATGIVVLLTTESKVTGAIVTVAGMLGITTGGARARFGALAGRLQSQLWGAALDLAIGEAALTGPDGWNASVDGIAVPASGERPKAADNLNALERFRKALQTGSAWRIRRLLAPRPVFVGDGAPTESTPREVARWLARLPANARVGAPSNRVESPGPSVLVALREDDGSAEVWWFQEGKVRYWREFTGPEEARASACALSQGQKPDDEHSAIRVYG